MKLQPEDETTEPKPAGELTPDAPRPLPQRLRVLPKVPPLGVDLDPDKVKRTGL